ncbi:hypothetical protein [Paenibacillus polymyxa]|nr:hypothetical protein [Paenibacillus polymyxa]
MNWLNSKGLFEQAWASVARRLASDLVRREAEQGNRLMQHGLIAGRASA